MNQYLQKVSNNIKIDEGQLVLQNILINIYFKEGISTKELARINLLPIPITTAIKKEFIKQGILLQENGVRLTQRGKDYIEKELGFSGLNKELYRNLLMDPGKEQKEIIEIKQQMTEIFNNRPEVDVSLDQSKCTIETAVKRAFLCLKNSTLINKKILCLGDDDLVSIAIGFLLKKLYADIRYNKTKIVVMDIDQRILEYIRAISEKENLPIECIPVDFKMPLPVKYKDGFDCLFTDPPYTLQGMELFLSRGIEALKKESGLSIFLSYGQKSPDFYLNMQKIFSDMGLIVVEIKNSFNRYDGAGIIGGVGQMIVLRSTGRTKATIENAFEGKIYTGEFNVTVRYYQCLKCGEIIEVGATKDIKTIEDLKKSRCCRCKNQTFKLIKKNCVNAQESL